MVDFTVAVRTYNSEKNISHVLDALLTQIGTEEILWEIIIVDNNSSDNTANIVSQYQSIFIKLCPLKYYFEPQQGASIARRRAMNEAQGSWVAFLDDDNVPSSNWVATAYHFGQHHPKAGAYSGKIQGDFEVEPPTSFEKIATYLAIIDRGDQSFCYNNHKKNVLPPGAGIVIYKQAWLKSVPERLFLLGPSGQSLSMKGEDIEVLCYLQNAGWEIWYVPEILIYHKIPAWRMERTYLLSLARNSGLTRHHIRMIRLRQWQRPFAFFAYLINDIWKILNYFFKNYKEIKSDAVKGCELQVLGSILVSPFYTLILRFRTHIREAREIQGNSISP